MPINDTPDAFAVATGLFRDAPVMPMSAASEAQASDALRAVRAMFQRTLASWASDMLLLQRRGLHQPTWESPASQRLRKAA